MGLRWCGVECTSHKQNLFYSHLSISALFLVEQTQLTSSGIGFFCLDKLPEIKGSPVLLLREGFAEDQPVCLPSSPPAC